MDINFICIYFVCENMIQYYMLLLFNNNCILTLLKFRESNTLYRSYNYTITEKLYMLICSKNDR